MTIRDDIQKLDAAAFSDLRAWLLTEEDTRRANAPALEEAKRAQKAETVAAVAAQLARSDPKLTPPAKADEKVRPWKPWHPTDPSTQFYYGDLVTLDGKTYRNVNDPTRTQPNVWQPGAEGIDERYWVEEVPPADDTTPDADDTTTPDGTQDAPLPFTAGLALTVGQYVTDKGVTYKVIQAHTSAAHWPPADVPAMFQKV